MTDIEHEKEESPVPVEERSRAPPPEASRAAGGHRVATSTYRGVCWHRKSRRWQSAINSSGRHVYLGSFDTEEEAARMFDKVAIRVRGHKAKLNFPYEDYVGPDGQLITDSKLEQLVSEAQKPLLEKQRWQEAQDDAGVDAKRRRLMHAQSSSLNGYGGPWNLGPVAGVTAVPGASDIMPLGVGLGLTQLSHDAGLGMYGSSGTAGIHTGLDLSGGAPELPFERLGGIVAGGPSRPGDVGGVIATEGLLSRLLQQQQQQQQHHLLPGEQSAAAQLLLQASLGGGGGSGSAGGEAPPGSVAAALKGHGLSGLELGGLVGGGCLTRCAAGGPGVAGGSLGDVAVRPEAATLLRLLLPAAALNLSTPGTGPAAGAAAASSLALNASGAGAKPTGRVQTLAVASRGLDEDEKNEEEEKGDAGLTGDLGARAGPRMRYQATGSCLLNLDSGGAVTGGSAQRRWDSLGQLLVTGGAVGSSRVVQTPIRLSPQPQSPEGPGGLEAAEQGAVDAGGGGGGLSAGRNKLKAAPLPPLAPHRQAPAVSSPSALPSLIARFLANVWDHLPAGMMVDSLVPSSDTALLGFTYMPAAAGRAAGVGVGMARARAGSNGGAGAELRPAAGGLAVGAVGRYLPSADGNSGDNGASGSGNDTGTMHARQGSVGSDGSGGGGGVVMLARGMAGGAGVYFRGIYRDLGVYTTMTDAMQACKACMAMLLDVQEVLLGSEVAAASATAQEQSAPQQLAGQQQSLQAGQGVLLEQATRSQRQPELGGVASTATAAPATRPAAAAQFSPAERPLAVGVPPLGSATVQQSKPHPRQPHHDQEQAWDGVLEGRQGLDQLRASGHQQHPPRHRPHPHQHDMHPQPRQEEAPHQQPPTGNPLKREDGDGSGQAGLGFADPEGVQRAQLQAQLLQYLQARAAGVPSIPASAMATATTTVAATAAAAAAASAEAVGKSSGAQGNRRPYGDLQQPTRRSPSRSRGEKQHRCRSAQPQPQPQPPELVTPQTLQLLLLQLLASSQHQQAQLQAQLPALSVSQLPLDLTLLQPPPPRPPQQRTAPPQLASILQAEAGARDGAVDGWHRGPPLRGICAASGGPHLTSPRDALGTGLLRHNHHQKHLPDQQQRQDSGISDSTTESSGSMRASRAGQEQPAGGGSRTSSERGLPGNEEGREQAPRGVGLTAA